MEHFHHPEYPSTTLSLSQIKRGSHDELSSTSRNTHTLPFYDKKRKFDAIVHKLNVVTNSKVDYVPTAKLHLIHDQRYSLNDLSFLENVINNETANAGNGAQAVSKSSLAHTLVNQEETLKKTLLSQENQLKIDLQNLNCYKEIYDDYMLERLGNGKSSLAGLSSETKYVNLLVKDAIYVLDPKFVNVLGTYLRGYSETQTKTTKLATDYLRPNWNENINFKVTRDNIRVYLEFILVEKDEYVEKRDTVFGKGSFLVEQSKANGTPCSGWHSIYDVFNDTAEIGKINLTYEVLPCEMQGLEQLIRSKEADIQALQKNITQIKDELAQMDNFYSSLTFQDEQSTAANQLARMTNNPSYFYNQYGLREGSAPHCFTEEKEKFEARIKFFVLALALMSIMNCFFRPDFLSLVVSLVLFFYLKDEWTEHLELKSQIALAVTILYDVIWVGKRYIQSMTSDQLPHVYFIAFPTFLTLLELAVKVGILVNITNFINLKKKRTLA